MLSMPRLAVLISASSLLACSYDPPAPNPTPTKWSQIKDYLPPIYGVKLADL